MRSPGRPPPHRDVQRQFWRRIAEGMSSEDAAAACGVSPPMGSRWFRHGGMPPMSLEVTSGRCLCFAEREEILWKAERVARRPKTAKLADNDRLRQYVEDRLSGAVTAADGTTVSGPLVPWKGRRHGRRQDRRWATAWSPEQIARRLPIDFPDDASMRVSHEAIHQALYVQGRGALRRELTTCLRTGRALRVPSARAGGCGG
jgi:hypothetical protein